MKHAGFWRQLAAVLIDQFVIMLPSTIVSGIYYYIAVAEKVDPTVASGNADMIVVALVIALSAVYYIFLNGRYGVTLGRFLLKLKLTRVDEPIATASATLARPFAFCFLRLPAALSALRAYPRCRSSSASPSTALPAPPFCGF